MNKKTLIIVESPAKARNIQKHLDNSYVVVACKGHIVDLAKGGKHGMGIDLNNKFAPHYIILDDQVGTLQMIMDEAKLADIIFLGSDADREGESIAYHLAQRLQDFGKPMKRIEMHEITKKGIEDALKSPREIDMNLFRAQEGRRFLDRIVGFTASPYLMQFFGPKLSAGRVQSVITRMVVDREEEIDIFKPEEYFTIQAQLAKGLENFTTKYDKKITDKTIAAKIKEELEGKELSAKYVVIKVDAAEEKKKPFPPLITAKLQQIMSKRFSMSSDRTMAAAQSLYESGYITYMRTDSVSISDEALKSSRKWLKENNYDIPRAANKYSNKNNSADAHECIRPTNIDDTPENISLAIPDEKQVYTIVWQYFMASQMMPAIYDTLKVSINLKNNTKHTLTSSGKALKYKGFLEILGAIDNNIIDIPNLTVGDELVLFGKNPVIVERKQTQPPPRYSEAELIKTLEKKEIGRPATYSSLISTITNRNYVEKDGNIFYPTELGQRITNELTQWFSFLEYNYTAEMESKLDQIAEGKLDHITMLTDFYNVFKEELRKAYIKHGSKPCDKCDSGFMREITAKNGDKFLGCGNYPKCRNAQPIKNVA